MTAKFIPLRTTDPDLARVQDAVARAVNPLLKRLDGTPPTVTGSRGGNAALASLLSALATLGLIVDETT